MGLRAAFVPIFF